MAGGSKTESSGRLPARVGAAEQIAADLRRQIMSGHLTIGARLAPERELAASYGVSVNTVREAIRSLAMLGLVETRHGSGTFVAGQSDALIAKLFAGIFEAESVTLRSVNHLGRAILRQAALLAVAAAEDADLASIQDAVEAITSAQGPVEVADAVERYRIALQKASHDPLLTRLSNYMTRLVFHLSRQHTTFGFWEERVVGLQPARQALLDALTSRSTVAAATAADDYSDGVEEILGSIPGMLDLSLDDVSDLPNT